MKALAVRNLHVHVAHEPGKPIVGFKLKPADCPVRLLRPSMRVDKR